MTGEQWALATLTFFVVMQAVMIVQGVRMRGTMGRYIDQQRRYVRALETELRRVDEKKMTVLFDTEEYQRTMDQ